MDLTLRPGTHEDAQTCAGEFPAARLRKGTSSSNSAADNVKEPFAAGGVGSGPG